MPEEGFDRYWIHVDGVKSDLHTLYGGYQLEAYPPRPAEPFTPQEGHTMSAIHRIDKLAAYIREIDPGRDTDDLTTTVHITMEQARVLATHLLEQGGLEALSVPDYVVAQILELHHIEDEKETEAERLLEKRRAEMAAEIAEVQKRYADVVAADAEGVK